MQNLPELKKKNSTILVRWVF